MSRPYTLKGQPQRADPAYLQRLHTLRTARKAARAWAGQHKGKKP